MIGQSIGISTASGVMTSSNLPYVVSSLPALLTLDSAAGDIGKISITVPRDKNGRIKLRITVRNTGPVQIGTSLIDSPSVIVDDSVQVLLFGLLELRTIRTTNTDQLFIEHIG